VPGEPSKRFPCLVDLKQVRAAEQIWATAITTIPLQKGFLERVASVDLFSRNVYSFGEACGSSWKFMGNLGTEFALDALEMAHSSGRKPEIFHFDQGCQFPSSDFLARLEGEKVKFSWSGRERCYDNILLERLWQTLKYRAEGFSAKPS
jgi:putative transposase